MELNNRGFENYVQRVPTNKGNLHFPGLYSDDPQYLNMMGNLHEALEKSHPASNTQNGMLLDPFIVGDWGRLRTISGYMMNPLGVPATNRPDIPDGFIDPRHEKAFSAILDAWFDQTWTPRALKINTFSNSGPPHFSYDPSLKINYYQLFGSQHAKLKSMIMADDWVGIYKKFGLGMMSAITRRFQNTDSVAMKGGRWVPKERKVTSFEGDIVSCDKTTMHDGFFAQRVRLAVAFSASYSIFLNSVFNGYRKEAMAMPVYHHTTPHAISSKLQRTPFVLGVDVTQFDQHVPQWALHLIFDRLGRDFDPSVVRMCQRSLTAPFLVNEDRIGGDGRHKWLSDPSSNDAYSDLYIGIPSGVPYVSDAGKMIGLWVDLVVLLDTGVIDPEDVPAIMAGTHPKVQVLNSGDDAVLGFVEKSDYDDAKRYLEEGKHPYFKVELESPISFLGNLICYNRGAVVAYPNLSSYVMNVLIRERPITSRFSKHWAFGWRERENVFSAHPMFYKVKEVMNKIAKSSLGKSFEDIVPYEAAPQGFDVTNFYDALFLEKPDRIHYQFSERMVSASLLDTIYITVPEHEVRRISSLWRTGGSSVPR